MLPKSKRAKRRNRHGKFWFGWDSIKMRGGVIVYG